MYRDPRSVKRGNKGRKGDMHLCKKGAKCGCIKKSLKGSKDRPKNHNEF